MLSHTLAHLLKGTDATITHGDPDVHVTGISYDSRTVQPGDLFVALPGSTTDGHEFLQDAANRGAVAVAFQRPNADVPANAAAVRVSNCPATLSRVSAAFHGEPSDHMRVLGITGTDGKSTTAYFAWQLLRRLGFKPGLLSTPLVSTEGESIHRNPFRQSTPEAPEVHELLAQMKEQGCDLCVLEATSHGLSRKTSRLLDIRWDAAVLTNVRHEHLDFHGSFDRYRRDKAELFRALDQPLGFHVTLCEHASAARTSDAPAAPGGTASSGMSPGPAGVPGAAPEGSSETTSLGDGRPIKLPHAQRFGVLNVDDPSARLFQKSTSCHVHTYSPSGADAEVLIRCVEDLGSSVRFELVSEGERFPVELPVPGRYNMANAVAAATAVRHLTRSHWREVIAHVADLELPPGRMTLIEEGQAFSVIVDFAHSPGAFEALFPPIRERTRGKLIAVFGSAGERDRKKRKLQGAIADRYADLIILTDEDPRQESPSRILDDIACGCGRHKRGVDLHLVPDRKTAIRQALKLAGANDMVLLLGKGHESSIEYATGSIDWNEIETARTILHDMGYRHG